MGKLIKYEWKKQRTSRLVIMAALAVGILAFVWGLIFDKGNASAAGIVVVLMFSMAFLVLLYTGIESILVLNRDLRTKQSYMLWMVPKSIWEILGAKFIAAILQMFVVFVSFIVAGCICLGVAVVEYGGIRTVFEMADVFAQKVLSVNISWGDLFMLCTSVFVAWTDIICIGFLSVILARTVLVKSRFAGLLAVIIFFAINFAVDKVMNILYYIPAFEDARVFAGWNPWDIVYYIFIGVVLFGVSGWVADKKLSV